MKQAVLERTLEGTEASRRVGFALYYKKCEEVDELKWLLRMLGERVLHDKRLRHDDDIVILANEILRSVHR